MLKSLDLNGRVAVVIGGTSGLGCAIALGLAEAGADVVATGRREALVRELCGRISGSGRRSLAITVDVRERESVEAFRDLVMEHLGEVHVLVNAAGVMSRKPTLAVTEGEWQSTLDANVTGALRACQAFYPVLSASGRGRVINI